MSALCPTSFCVSIIPCTFSVHFCRKFIFCVTLYSLACKQVTSVQVAANSLQCLQAVITCVRCMCSQSAFTQSCIPFGHCLPAIPFLHAALKTNMSQSSCMPALHTHHCTSPFLMLSCSAHHALSPTCLLCHSTKRHHSGSM